MATLHELRWFYDSKTNELVQMHYWGEGLWCEGTRKPIKVGKELKRALKVRFEKLK